jgi:hypothetical protein
MRWRPSLPKSQFHWSALSGGCRFRLLAGLLLLALACAYTAYSGQRFSKRGVDDLSIDQPLVRLAHNLTPPPRHLRTIEPANNREFYLVTVISDQQDLIFGLTLLLLRMILSLTVGGLGLVLLTAGSTEWRTRSEAVTAAQAAATAPAA